MAIVLGSKVKDMYTGFTGIAVARAEYLYGCARISVEPTELEAGKLLDSAWFDEQRIELIEEEPAKVSEYSSALSGGPQKDPQRGKDA